MKLSQMEGHLFSTQVVIQMLNPRVSITNAQTARTFEAPITMQFTVSSIYWDIRVLFSVTPLHGSVKFFQSVIKLAGSYAPPPPFNILFGFQMTVVIVFTFVLCSVPIHILELIYSFGDHRWVSSALFSKISTNICYILWI